MDQFMTAIDKPPIQIQLQDCIPGTTQRPANRIVSKFFEKLNTVGSAYGSDDPYRELSQKDEAMYTLAQQTSGASLRKVKPYENKGPCTEHLERQDAQTKKGSRIPSPFYMRGTKECFVCE